jgi:hypothetical protein
MNRPATGLIRREQLEKCEGLLLESKGQDYLVRHVRSIAARSPALTTERSVVYIVHRMP